MTLLYLSLMSHTHLVLKITPNTFFVFLTVTIMVARCDGEERTRTSLKEKEKEGQKGQEVRKEKEEVKVKKINVGFLIIDCNKIIVLTVFIYIGTYSQKQRKTVIRDPIYT